MSISYTTVENSALLEKASAQNRKDFIRVKVDPTIFIPSPFSSEFKFPSCFLPKKYITMADRIQNFKIRLDDIWVASYPKAGTTWTMNIVWQLMNHMNFSAKFLTDEDLYFERAMLVGESSDSDSEDFKESVKRLDKQLDVMADEPSPRLLKSHLPAHLLPKDIWTVKPKLIYVVRDAKDVAISMYHMYRNHSRVQFTGTMEDYFDVFLNDFVVFGPFYEHINSFKQISKLEHILLINYEQMIADPFTEVKRISEFLGYEYTDIQLKQLMEHASFGNMRKKIDVNLKVYPNGFK